MSRLYMLPLAFVGAPAFAAVPADVTTALTNAATDGAAVATLVLLVVIAIAAVKYLRRAT